MSAATLTGAVKILSFLTIEWVATWQFPRPYGRSVRTKNNSQPKIYFGILRLKSPL